MAAEAPAEEIPAPAQFSREWYQQFSGPYSAPVEPFRIEASALGLRPGIDLDQALELAARLEDEETLRKLELRK